LGRDDRSDLRRGRLDRLVDDDVAEPGVLVYLRGRRAQALLDGGRALATAPTEPPLERRIVGWEQEDRDRVGEPDDDLPRALHVDIEEDLGPPGERRIDLSMGGSVEMPVDKGPLDEPPLRADPLELLCRDEVVVDP